MQAILKIELLYTFKANTTMSPKYADVETQYKKCKGLKREDVQNMQEWILSQPHLPKITDLQMIIFLYSCHNSNEATKICIDDYYTMRTHCPEFFASRNPNNEEVKTCMNTVYEFPLPKLTPDGHVVMYARLRDTNPSVFSFDSSLKVMDMAISLALTELGALEGHIIVIDLQGVQLQHVLKLGIMSMKKFLTYLQEALPFRIKGFLFVNAVPFIDKILALMKPFLKKELADMIEIHQSNSPGIYKKIPKDCWPNELDGTAGPLEEIHRAYVEKVRANVEFFLEEEKMLADETKRPGKPKDVGELFGVEGTFKKLDID